MRCLKTLGTLAIQLGPNTLNLLQPEALKKQNHPFPPLLLIPNCDIFGRSGREKGEVEENEKREEGNTSQSLIT